jgi:UDP-glucuronate decarboxylase
MKSPQDIVLKDIEEISQVKTLRNQWKKLEGKTILITGSGGFLGSYIVNTVEYLNNHVLKKPCKLIGLDRTPITTARNENFKFIAHDVTKPLEIKEKIHFIIHAAGDSSPAKFQANELGTIDVNVEATRWLLELARKKKVESMLYFSSGAIYGNPPKEHAPTPETYNGNTSTLGGRSCYSESKRLAETLCNVYAKNYQVPVKIARIFVIYGPGVTIHDKKVYSDFMNCALNKKPITMKSDGTDLRSDTYVSDAVTAFWLLLFSNKNGEAFNVGTDEKEYTIKQLAQEIHKACKIEASPKCEVRKDLAHIKSAPKRFCADITKIKTELGFAPTVKLPDGVKRTVEWNKLMFFSGKKYKNVFMVSCAILCRKEGMADYFKRNSDTFAIVNVIPNHLKDQKPVCNYYENGKLKKSIPLITLPRTLAKSNPYITNIGYVFSIVYAAFTLRKKFDIFIGEGHIYSLAGVLLRFLGFWKKIIYSSGDYFVNVASFQIIDKFLAKNVDAIWSASRPMVRERKKRVKDASEKCLQTVMPLGINVRERAVKNKAHKGNNVLFIGNVQKQQGVDLLVDAMSIISKSKPKLAINVHVVGKGVYLEQLKEKVRGAGLQKRFKFFGFVESDAKLDKIMRECFVGTALYDPKSAHLTKLSDPGKIKDYLAAGIPVITTNVSPISQELEDTKAGTLVPYKEQRVAEAILKMHAKKTRVGYSQNALKLAESYAWDKVLDKVFEETVEFWETI